MADRRRPPATAGDEKNAINGGVYPLEDYGSMKPPGPEDKVNLVGDDQLVSTDALGAS